MQRRRGIFMSVFGISKKVSGSTVYLNCRWYLGKSLQKEFGRFQDLSVNLGTVSSGFDFHCSRCFAPRPGWSFWNPKGFAVECRPVRLFSGSQEAKQQNPTVMEAQSGRRAISLSACKFTEASVLFGPAVFFSPGWGNMQLPLIARTS